MGTHPVSAGIAKREIDLRHKIVFVLGALPTKLVGCSHTDHLAEMFSRQTRHEILDGMPRARSTPHSWRDSIAWRQHARWRRSRRSLAVSSHMR